MDVGIKPIRQKFLEPNFLFALNFFEGYVFGRVARRRICLYKPYPVISSAGAAIDISASTAQSELRFRDSRNTEVDILYLEDPTKGGYPWFYHGAIGIKPQYINMYLRFPEGKEIPGKFVKLDPIRPDAGNDVGYLNSLLSPYEEPTDAIEIIIPPKQHLGAEYYNKDSARSHNPVLNLLFALYWIQIFNTEKYANLIRKIALREVPASFMTVGFGETPFELASDVAKDWDLHLEKDFMLHPKKGVYRPMSLDEAVGLGGR